VKVNISAIKTFQYDQMDWYYAYVLKRVPRRPEMALHLGTLWHTLLEEFAKSGSKDAAKEVARQSIEQTTQFLSIDPASNSSFVEEFLDDSEHLFNLFDAYEERHKFDETLAVEGAIEMPILGGPHTLIGRPDRVVLYQKKFWHVQNRTLSDRTVMPVYLAAAERDIHELGYAAMICHKYGEPLIRYGGTLMNICRKVSKKKLAEDPHAAFIQEFIPIDPKQVAEALEDISQIADDMDAISRGARRALQNRDTDKGRFGNRLSAYFEVKLGRASIYDDHLFQTSVSRYESEPAVVLE